MKPTNRRRTWTSRPAPWDTKRHSPTNMSVHFSSRSSAWATPPDLFARLDAEFQFTLDVCAVPENAKCSRFFTPAADGLKQSWQGVCWMNPPYGRTIGKWLEKAFGSAQEGATVVCLLPARTDTAWWHQYVMRATEIRFVRGRLRFGEARHGAPFPSAVVVFHPKPDEPGQSGGVRPPRIVQWPDDDRPKGQV